MKSAAATPTLHQSWLTIWSEPRQTIRRIVEVNPEYGADIIATLWFFFRFTAPGLTFEWAPGETTVIQVVFGALAKVVFVLVGALVAGKLFLYLYNTCLYGSGRALGGRAGYLANWGVLGWSMLPGVLTGLVLFLFTAVMAVSPPVDLGSGRSILIVGLYFVLPLVWQGYFLVIGLMEIQGFSAARAVSAVILTAVFFVLLWAGCYGLVFLASRASGS